MRERFARWICRTFHGPITRPVFGQYECLRCFRRYQTGWNASTGTAGIHTMPHYERAVRPRIVRQGSA